MRPSHTCPRYVIAQVKRILARAGFPLSRKSGTYSPYGSTSKRTPGFVVQRVGYGKSVAVDFTAGHDQAVSHFAPKMTDAQKAQHAAGLQILRDRGYTFNECGWVECDGYDF